MRSLKYLNTILTVIAVLLALHLWTLWTVAPSSLPTVEAAGIPDSGAQRQQMINELKLLNQKAEQIKGLFTTGRARVTVVNPAGDGERKPRR